MTSLVGAASLLMPSSGLHRHPALDPQTVGDLALDQLIARLESGRKAYDLGADYSQLLGSEAEVTYRQDVFRDLDGTSLRGLLSSFCEQMVHVRRTLPSEGCGTRSRPCAPLLGRCRMISTLPGDLWS